MSEWLLCKMLNIHSWRLTGLNYSKMGLVSDSHLQGSEYTCARCGAVKVNGSMTLPTLDPMGRLIGRDGKEVIL